MPEDRVGSEALITLTLELTAEEADALACFKQLLKNGEPPANSNDAAGRKLMILAANKIASGFLKKSSPVAGVSGAGCTGASTRTLDSRIIQAVGSTPLSQLTGLDSIIVGGVVQAIEDDYWPGRGATARTTDLRDTTDDQNNNDEEDDDNDTENGGGDDEGDGSNGGNTDSSGGGSIRGSGSGRGGPLR
ncbi:MAG: hypothetical protein AAF937_02450 [Planctomycetota bacterium]